MGSGCHHSLCDFCACYYDSLPFFAQQQLAKSRPRSLLELLRRPLAAVGLDAARRLDVKLLHAQESPSPSWGVMGCFRI